MTTTTGYKYTMVAYGKDSNAIMVNPMKSEEGTELTRAYKFIQNTLKDRGLKPKNYILDNEFSNTLKIFMTEEEELFQLVPPEIHRRNTAERHTQSRKSHFIS